MCLLRVRSLFLATLAAALAAGCGEGSLSSPTAPSALSDSTEFAVDGGSFAAASTAGDEFAALGSSRGGSSGGSGKGKDKSDRGKGGGSFDSGDDDDGEDDEPEANHGRRRNLSGFVTAVGADSITIRGIAVKVTPATVIRHGHRRLTLAQIAVGDHAQAKGIMSADGTTMTATEIKVEDTGNDNEDAEAKVRGVVAGLSGTCPGLTFTVGTTMVTTNISTKFEDGTCAGISNGTRLEVTGFKQPDGSILASEVEFDLDELEGPVAGLAGTCPSRTFTIGTTTVTTSASTTYEGVTCATLADGMRVEVEGALNGATLAATKVELD